MYLRQSLGWFGATTLGLVFPQTLRDLVLKSTPAVRNRPWTTRPWGDFRVSYQLPSGENPLGQKENICDIHKNRPKPESFLL